MSRHPSKRLMVLQYIILIFACLFAFYPVWFAILASGRLGDRLYTLDIAGMFVPTQWTWDNYRIMLYEKP